MRKREDGKTRTTAFRGTLKLARLTVITLAVGAIGWSVALGAPVAAVQAGTDPVGRSAPLSRARTIGEISAPAEVTLDIDGLRVKAAGTTEQTVGQLLAGLGVQLQPTDRLSVDAAQALVPGMRLVLDRGVPVTLVDGGQSELGRAPRGTVAGLLAARGIVLGPLDKLETPAAAAVEAWVTVKITRVSDREVTEREPVPYPVRYVNDTNLEVGRQTVETPGVAGEALRTWLIRSVDGRESARSLLSETTVTAPVAEIRRVGVRPRVIPPPPAEIERIITEAAEAWGADASQLMRVAWCESRYNPNAYNPTAQDTGLFQFIPETWRRESARAGYGGVSAFDPVASANTAAMLFSEGKSRLWTCK